MSEAEWVRWVLPRLGGMAGSEGDGLEGRVMIGESWSSTCGRVETVMSVEREWL